LEVLLLLIIHHNNTSLISTTYNINYSDTSDESDSNIISNNIVNKKFTDFKTTLAQACCESHMTYMQINSILKVLREHECLKNLSKNVRTLLNTPKDCNKKIRDIFPGQYLHVGICENIFEKLHWSTPF